jgi:hypothetical protein
VTLKWGAAEPEIQKLIGTTLRQVTAGYCTMTVVPLGGLRCSLGLHFDRKGRWLQELEFFRTEPRGVHYEPQIVPANRTAVPAP